MALSRPQEVSAHLTRFCEQCKEQKACRFLAAEKGAYSILLETWKLAAAGDRGLLLQALNALSALTDGQPDLLDTQGLQLLVATLAHNAESAHVTCSGIRCVRLACLKHEQNRQSLVKAGVLPLLTGAIARHSRCADVVREACWALRVMTFDDDIRVPFGHAHDHAKMIVQENGGLKVLIEAAKGRSRCGEGEESGFGTASSMIGSRHQLYLSVQSHLHDSPSRMLSLPLVLTGESKPAIIGLDHIPCSSLEPFREALDSVHQHRLRVGWEGSLKGRRRVLFPKGGDVLLALTGAAPRGRFALQFILGHQFSCMSVCLTLR